MDVRCWVALALLLLVAFSCESLTISKIYNPDSASWQNNQSVVSISSLIFQNCADKFPSNSSQLAVLIPFNSQLTNFLQVLENNDSSRLPSKLPVEITNGLPQLLVVDLTTQVEIPTYLDPLMPMIQTAGFDGMVVRSAAQFNELAWFLFRFWSARHCEVPVYATTLQQFPSDGEFVFSAVTMAQLDYEENTEKAFIRTPLYIILVSIPAYATIIVLAFQSVRKLYLNRFPRNINPGAILCLLGLLLTIVMFAVTSEAQNQKSTMPWVGTQNLICLTVLLSAVGSYLLAFQFHKAVLAGRGEDIDHMKFCKDWKVIVSAVMLVLHVLLFYAAGMALALPKKTTSNAATLWSFLVSVTYVSYKLFISIYFFWGHWNVYRVFKKTASKSTMDSSSTQIARRLGWVSLFNFLGLLTTLVYSITNNSNHCWALMVWSLTFMALTTLFEVQAVPVSADAKTLHSFKVLRATTSFNKTSSAGANSDQMVSTV